MAPSRDPAALFIYMAKVFAAATAYLEMLATFFQQMPTAPKGGAI